MANQPPVRMSDFLDGPFRNAFEYAAIGMVLADTDGRCLAANQSFCQLIGYSEAELLQLSFAALTHPDDLSANLELGRQLLNGDIPTYRLEKRYFHKTGQIIWAVITASVMRDNNNLPLYVITQVLDITERKQAEQALRRSEASQRALINALPDFLFQISPEGVIVSYQGPPSQRPLLPEQQLSDRSIYDLLPPNLQQPFHDALAKARQSNTPQLMEISYPVRGQIEHYEVRLSAIEHDGTLLVVRKITARVRAEQAEREQRALAEAMQAAAESFNTTLNFDEVLDRILDHVHDLIPHDLASILLVDDQRVARLVRYRSYTDHQLDELAPTIRLPIATTANLRRLADSGQPLIIDNVYDWPGWIVMPGLEWVHAFLGAPIQVKGQTVGFLNLNAATPRLFTPEHAHRLQAFTHQAALAIENARLLQAEREQSDLAEALRDTSEALNRTLAYNEVLDRILANAARVTPYDAINIMSVNVARDQATVVRYLGYAERGIEEWVRHLTVSLLTTPGMQRMLITGQPLIVADTRTQPDWADWPETRWVRSYIGVPFQLDGQVVGFLNLDSLTPNFFTNEHAARLRAFANQVALAIRNARLYESTQRSLQRLTALYEASLELTHSSDALDLHRRLLRAAVRLVSANASSLMLYTSDQQLVIVAVENMPTNLIGRRTPLGHGLNGRAALTHRIQQVADYHTFDDPLQFMLGLPLIGLVSVPLIWQERLIGTVSISDQAERAYDEDDLHTLSLFATLAAAMLEQARALNEAQARETEARLLSGRLASAQEEERRRIAAFLHDTVGNQLVLMQKNTELLQGMLATQDLPALLNHNLELLLQAHQQVRSLAADLDSRVLTDLGLAPAVRQHVERLCASTGLPIQLHVTGEARRLPTDIERVIFRALQEALVNVLRHAQATEISAQLHFGNSALRLTVQDNGRGFNLNAASSGTELGLPALRRQIEALHGEFMLESSPGFGTVVAVQIPLETPVISDRTQVRVLIADDHDLVRQGLRQLLAATTEFVCVGEAADSLEAVRQVELYRPQLIIMDIKLSGGSGIEATRQIARRFPNAKVIMYTYHNDETYLEQAMQAGARGYLLKSDQSQLILAALRTVLADNVFITPELSEAWVKMQARPAMVSALDLLTSRERQVLHLVAQGNLNQAIADELEISIRTVEVHRRNIMDKLNLRNVAQLTKFAVDNNLV